MTKPHLLVVHRYFHPDWPPYATMLDRMTQALSTRWDVTVITSQPSYGGSNQHARAPKRERRGDVRIVRLPLFKEARNRPVTRAVNSVFFALTAAGRVAVSSRPVGVMAATTPPLSVAAAVSAAARLRRARFIYHNQDIYPEILENMGVAFKDSWRAKIMRRVDLATGRRSNRIVVLSDDMANTWRGRGLQGDSLVVINNFQPTIAGSEGFASHVIDEQIAPIELMFSGNVGPFQNLESLVGMLDSSDSARLTVVGDGHRLPAAKDAAGTATRFLDRVSAAEARNLLSGAHLGVVSLRPGVLATAHPSKVLSYLTSGLPLLAVIDPQSALARQIRTRGLGYVVEPGSRGDFETAIGRHTALDSGERLAMRRRCLEWSAANDEATQLDRWVALFDMVMEGRGE